MELIDNNPLVCADRAAVPGPLDTLLLIALGPLARGGLISEAPAIRTNAPTPSDPAYLAAMGWDGGIVLAHDPVDLGRVYALHALIAIATPDSQEEIDDLYEEAYGRSFFVRRDETSDWDAKLVTEQPFAAFRVGITPDEPVSLLRVQVMADREGKCGAAQAIHALNVMCGFEESLPFA